MAAPVLTGMLAALAVDVWTQVATTGSPTGREEAGSFMYDGKLCLLGGRGVKPVECFDPQTATWTAFAATTDDVHHATPVVLGDEVWVVSAFTGSWPADEAAIDQAIVYTPKTDTFSTGCNIPQQFRRGAAGVATHGGFVYVVNGATNGHLQEYGAQAYSGFSRFDPSSCEWLDMEAAPTHARDHFAAAVVGSRLVIAAGRDTPRGEDAEDVFVHTVTATEWYDLDADAGVWHAGADIPTARAGVVAAVDADGRLLVLGGEVALNVDASAAVEAYDVGSDKWETLPSMSRGRHGGGVGILGGTLYATVGVGKGGGVPLLTSTEALSLSGGEADAASCLRDIAGAEVLLRGDAGYASAKAPLNLRVDIAPDPYAVVTVDTVAAISATVRCATAAGLQACARAGGHSFENDSGCTGGILVDVQRLVDLSVDGESVSFGAGHTLGQLYHKLATQHSLLVPGGSVSGVGAAGLLLGCGRGLTTTLHGLFCDVLEAVEFVDAAGDVRVADADTDADMLWMARGAGGNFPGIATGFSVRAFAMPTVVRTYECTLAYDAAKYKAVIKAWGERLEAMAAPSRKLFTHLKLWGRPAHMILFAVCFDCSDAEAAWADAQLQAVAAAGSATPAASCGAVERTWLEQLLDESGVDEGAIANDVDALLDREQGWGKEPADTFKASKNGGQMGYTWAVPDAAIDAVLHWQYVEPIAAAYGVMVEFYPAGGPAVAAVAAADSAYGHRDAKWIVHVKHQWRPGDFAAHAAMMAHHDSLVGELADALGCAAFYNYIDNTLPCADTNDEWLGAYFSDVPRMKAIKAQQDPAGVFRSRLPSLTQRPPPPSPPPPPPPTPKSPTPPPLSTAEMRARPTLPSTVLGMNYAPDPSDYEDGQQWPALYYDSDFFTDDYAALWGSGGEHGRGDLAAMVAMGVNFVRLYDWNWAQSKRRGHADFLDECERLGLKVAVPVSNYVLNTCIRDGADWCGGAKAREQMGHIVEEAFEHRAAVGAFSIGNEIDLNGGLSSLDAIATAVKYIVDKEEQLGWPQESRPALLVPVSFAIRGWGARCPSLPGGYLCDVYAIVAEAIGADVAAKRLVHAVQSYNNGTVLGERFLAKESAVAPAHKWMNLQAQLRSAGLGAAAELPVILTEVGDFRLDADTMRGQIEAVLRAAPRAIGLAWFSWMDKPWKVGWGDWWESSFGIHTLIARPDRVATTISGLYLDGTNVEVYCGDGWCAGGEPAKYPVDSLGRKPAADVVEAAYLAATGQTPTVRPSPPPPPPEPCLGAGEERFLAPPAEAPKCCGAGGIAVWIGWNDDDKVNGFRCDGSTASSAPPTPADAASPPPPTTSPPPPAASPPSPTASQPPPTSTMPPATSSQPPPTAAPPSPTSTPPSSGKPPPSTSPPPPPPSPAQGPPCLLVGWERWQPPSEANPVCCNAKAQAVWLGWNNNDRVNGFRCDLPSAPPPPPPSQTTSPPASPGTDISPSPPLTSPPPPRPPSPPTAEFSAQCDAHPQCAALQLKGSCCPAPGGVFLSCCADLYEVPLYDGSLAGSQYSQVPDLESRARRALSDADADGHNVTDRGFDGSEIRPWRSRFLGYYFQLRGSPNVSAPWPPPPPVPLSPPSPPLPPSPPTSPAPSPSSTNENFPTVAVAIGSVVGVLVMWLLVMLLLRARSRNNRVDARTTSRGTRSAAENARHTKSEVRVIP